jgi:hypothetical protein
MEVGDGIKKWRETLPDVDVTQSSHTVDDFEDPKMTTVWTVYIFYWEEQYDSADESLTKIKTRDSCYVVLVITGMM